jgi:hypothetical protein
MNRSKQGRMGKKAIIVLVIGLTLASVHRAEAQQSSGKVPRLGYLSPGVTSDSYSREEFQQGLRGLGYVVGKNILIRIQVFRGES